MENGLFPEAEEGLGDQWSNSMDTSASSQCLITFPFAFPDEEFYSFGVETLQKACRDFDEVLVCTQFKDATVEVDSFQRLINHIYLTLAQNTRVEAHVVVIDPSIGLER